MFWQQLPCERTHSRVSSCLLVRRVLLQVLDKKGKLPKVLFLQMDNCWRENKNCIMWSYLSWLVEIGVFQKVHAGFLIVGYVLEHGCKGVDNNH
jgi:hypothetical protein